MKKVYLKLKNKFIIDVKMLIVNKFKLLPVFLFLYLQFSFNNSFAGIAFEGEWPSSCHVHTTIKKGIINNDQVVINRTKNWLPHIKKALYDKVDEHKSPQSQYPFNCFSATHAKEAFRFLLEDVSNTSVEDALFDRVFSKNLAIVPDWSPPLPPAENYFSEADIKSLYKAATTVIDLVKGEALIVGIGQSSAYLIEVIKARSTNDKHIISIPFSGTPDLVEGRLGKVLAPENLVTPSRLEFARSVMASGGFSPSLIKQKEIYLVDYVMTGENIRAFIKFMKDWFLDEHIAFPNVSLLKIGGIEYNAPRKQKFSFLNKDLGNKEFHFTIDTYGNEIPQKLLMTMIGADGNQRVELPFTAKYWDNETFETLQEMYPSSYAKEVITIIQERLKRF